MRTRVLILTLVLTWLVAHPRSATGRVEAEITAGYPNGCDGPLGIGNGVSTVSRRGRFHFYNCYDEGTGQTTGFVYDMKTHSRIEMYSSDGSLNPYLISENGKYVAVASTVALTPEPLASEWGVYVFNVRKRLMFKVAESADFCTSGCFPEPVILTNKGELVITVSNRYYVVTK